MSLSMGIKIMQSQSPNKPTKLVCIMTIISINDKLFKRVKKKSKYLYLTGSN